MRVQLKGINSRRKRLADGREVTYYYAWKGGPRLHGKPGSPEFVASYNEAAASRRRTSPGTLQSILNAFQDSGEWDRLADRTRSDYVKKIRLIETEFGTFPLAALKDRRTRNEFLTWRDQLGRKSRRQADMTWTVLARILAWALGRHLVDANPCTKAGRLYEGGARREKIWSADQERAFLAVASPQLRLAFILALHTGQRQGDLLRLPWSAYDGTSIRLKQSKTGARVRVPVTAVLRAVLDETKRVSPLILTGVGKRPWTADGFRSSWRKACLKAKIEGVTFHDLRGTAVTRLAIAGCTEAEIATISGHSLAEVRSILDQNYLSRDYALAKSGIAKLETRTKTPDQAPDRADGSNIAGEKA